MSKPRTTTLTDQLAALLQRRAELSEKRQLAVAAPRPLDEAKADIPKAINLLAERCTLPAYYLAQSEHGWHDLATAMLGSPYQPADPPAALLAKVFPKNLRERIEYDLTQAYDALPEPLPTLERAKQLSELDTELAALERQISAAWWSADAAGLALPVPDISAAALLGLEN